MPAPRLTVNALKPVTAAPPTCPGNEWSCAVQAQMQELEEAGEAADLEASRYVSGLLFTIVRNAKRLGTLSD